LGDIVREDLHPLTELINKVWDESTSELGSGFIGFNYELLFQQSLGVQRRLIRRAIQLLRPKLRDIDYKAISKAVGFIRSPSRSGSIDLVSGINMLIELDQLWFYDKSAKLPADGWPQLQENSEYKLEIPGTLNLQHTWQINISESELPDEKINFQENEKDSYSINLDHEKLNLPLTVRTRNPGDFIKPIGMEGHKIKLSDLFINKKIPVRLRELWPIVCSGVDIVWVPGLHFSQDFEINGNTMKYVRISVSSQIKN
jgi:tRNA(Ile)-lysidine synthase